ncbi:hypothetical protein PRIC1_001464 [Phytophthora ramorum]|nr:hypothetical protein KRP22_7227 [Phytophthora ramorum]
MGNSNSADLSAALQSPSGPMRSLAASFIAAYPTSLHVKMSLGGSSATVTDAATSNAICALKDKPFSSRVFLNGQQGETLVTMKKSTFSNKFHVFPGDQTDREQFVICDASGIFNTMLMVAQFHDQKTGGPCRVVVKGSASKHVVLCYLERGSPTLSQLQNSEDFNMNKGKYQRIGRISRNPKLFGRAEYDVEAAAGVDLTLLLLILFIRHIRLERERAASSVA